MIDNHIAQEGTECSLQNTTQKGQCARGKMACQRGAMLCVPTNKSTSEICNGLDDDCDGLIDNPVRGSVVCNSGCTFPASLPVPSTDPHTYSHTVFLEMNPNNGDICQPKGRYPALRFHVSWDTFHGYRTVKFQAERGWSVRLLPPASGTTPKDYPFEAKQAKAQLSTPAGKKFEIVFDWAYQIHITIHSIRQISSTTP